MNGTAETWQCDECGIRIDVPAGVRPMPFYRCARCKGGHFTKVPQTFADATVAQRFDSYQAEVIPADAPTIQVEECRRAFHAGGLAVLLMVARFIEEDDLPHALLLIGRLTAECMLYQDNLKPGYSKGRTTDAG